MDQIISAHNKYILTKQNLQPATQNNCNCRTQSQCPLQGNCLTNNRKHLQNQIQRPQV
ncbi:hypothetical protein HOLleu_43794 [Holothuria leucospilota]|nr:hypothetical protein HOLleu_43794 [Holothuria leucospilota]